MRDEALRPIFANKHPWRVYGYVELPEYIAFPMSGLVEKEMPDGRKAYVPGTILKVLVISRDPTDDELATKYGLSEDDEIVREFSTRIGGRRWVEICVPFVEEMLEYADRLRLKRENLDGSLYQKEKAVLLSSFWAKAVEKWGTRRPVRQLPIIKHDPGSEELDSLIKIIFRALEDAAVLTIKRKYGRQGIAISCPKESCDEQEILTKLVYAVDDQLGALVGMIAKHEGLKLDVSKLEKAGVSIVRK